MKKALTPKQIAHKYVHGEHDALTDSQEKKDMIEDILNTLTSVFLVQHKRSRVIHGCFRTSKKAHKYVGDNTSVEVVEIEVR